MDPVKSGTPSSLPESSESTLTTSQSISFEDGSLSNILFGSRSERHIFLKVLLCRIDSGATRDYLEDTNSGKSLEERLVSVLAQIDLSKTDEYAAFVNGVAPLEVQLQLLQELMEAVKFEENHQALTPITVSNGNDCAHGTTADEIGEADDTGVADSGEDDSILKDYKPTVTSTSMELSSELHLETTPAVDELLKKKVTTQSTLTRQILGRSETIQGVLIP